MAPDMVDAVLTQPQQAPQNPQTPNQTDAVDDVLNVAASLPQITQHFDDPAGVSATLHAAITTQKTGQQPTAQQAVALSDAYKSIYGQRAYTMPGGNYDTQQYMQSIANNEKSFSHDIAATVGPHVASWLTNPLALVAPETALGIQQNAEFAYGASQQGSAGNVVGRVTNFAGDALPLLAGGTPNPAALPAYFGLTGAGGARQEVAAHRQDGADISGMNEAEYTVLTGGIQSLLAHYLGKLGAGGMKMVENGAATEVVPLQGLIRRLSPAMLESIQGTDGAILRPIVSRTLLNMGVGAGQNEVANIAQNLAANLTNVDNRDLTSGSLEALVQGAAFGGLGHVQHEVSNQSRGRVERVPQENVVDFGKTGEAAPRMARFADENPFPEAATPQQPLPPEGGRQLPVDQRLSQDKAFTDLTSTLKQQAAESDTLLSQPATDRLGGNGRLPNSTDLRTGEPDHPLVEMLRSVDPTVRQVPVPEALTDDFNVLKEHGITGVAVTGDKAPSGFSSSAHPDAVAIDVSNPEKSFMNVMAHEAGHIWHDLNPTKVDLMYRMIPEELKQKYQNWYYEALKRRQGTEYAQNYMAKYKKTETISMAFGAAAEGDAMVQRAFKRETGVWATVKDAFTRTLNKFSGKGRMLNSIADQMREGLGLTDTTTDKASGFDEGRAKKIAAAYDAMPHDPNNPKVKASYDAFKSETMQQYRDLAEKGVKVEPWEGEGQPYKNSRDMADDVKANKHLWVFTGGEMPSDHPLAEKSGVTVNGKELTHNDIFRAVHDVNGHAQTGANFGPKGEEQAWQTHSKMYSEKAQPAMTAETRGQNSWVNFGPHGEANRANPAATVYAEQKAGLLPDEFNPKNEGRQAPRSYLSMGHKGNEEIWWKDEDGTIQTSKAPSHAGEPRFPVGEEQFRGRVMHDTKEISVVAGVDDSPMGEKRMIATAKQLERKYPGYTAYVEGRGGMIPLHEAEAPGRFMLPKLENIANSKEDVEAYKDLLNKQSPANAIKFETSKEDKVKRAVFDTQAPVVNMIRTAMGRVNDVSKLSPEAYLRRMFGFRERRYQQEKQGLRSLTGEEILDKKSGENLTRNWVIDPLIQEAKKSGQKIEDVKAYAQSVMVAQRTLEKAAGIQAGGAKLTDAISGIGENRVSKGTPGERDAEEATEFLAKAAQDPHAAAAEEYARRLRLWGNEHMKMAVDGGLISTDQARAMLKENQFYVNMQRVMEDRGLLTDADFADSRYRRFRGSNRLIDDPLANTLQTTEQIAKKAEENFTKQKIIELVKPFGDMIQPASKAGGDTITVREAGEDKFYHVDPEVAATMNGWGQHVPPVLWGALSVPGRIKAWGTLLRPMFRWNHFRKQFQNRLLISQEAGGLKGIAATAKGFDADTKELLDVLGGTMGHERDYGTSSADYHRLISSAMDKMSGDKNILLGLPQKAWNGYQKLGEWSDAFNRIVEFKEALANAKRRGMNDLDAQTYAAWKARDLMDFSVAGEVLKQVNRIAYQPFLNAEVQGLRKMYELARENPGLAAQRLAVFGLLPAMIPYLWAKSQSKDAEARYKDTPLAQRIMFYQFHVGNYRLMVPKGQTQAMASAMWEAFLDKHNGDVGTWAKAMGDSGLVPRPVLDPESLLPFQGVREAISNYSWFYDRHIIPPDQEGLAMDLRHTDGASGIGQWLSRMAKDKAGWELDPRKIDHVLASDLGTSGVDVETASNFNRPDKPLGNVGALAYGDVRLPPGYTSVSIQDAMSAADRYRDTSSPQFKQVQEALSESYKATTVEERNRLVDQARAAADAANEFYRKHGDELLQVRKATALITEAVTTGKEQKDAGKAREWAAANPQQVRLIQDEGRLKTLDNRISELRKALVNPRLSDNTKAMADREISRLFSVIAKMVGDAKQNTVTE